MPERAQHRPMTTSRIVLAALLVLSVLAPARALAQPFVVATEELSTGLNGGLPLANQRFGESVAISADGSRVIVGASHYPTSATVPNPYGMGRVAIYARTGTAWALETTFVGTTQDENLGSAVALSADGSVALVGAPGRGSNRGGATVYRRTGSMWTVDGTLTPAGATGDDRAGYSVALSSDGIRAVVGRPWDDTARGVDSGSVTVFLHGSGGWSEETTFVPTTGIASGNYGLSVAISDAIPSGQVIVVGSVSWMTGANGYAYLHAHVGASWFEVARLFDSTGGSHDAFGTSVAIDAGAAHILVGAPQAGTAQAGRAVYFGLHGSEWRQDDVLVSPASAAGALFGTSVSLSSDGRRALVGAPREQDAGGTRIGVARLFLRTGTTFAADARLPSSMASNGDEIGTAVALAGGGAYAAVGAPLDDRLGTNDGSVHVFRLTNGLGTPCLTAGECASGFCADGVCCNTACARGTGTECQACVAARTGAAQGTCAPISAGTTCAASAGTCDPVHLCDGTSNACPTAHSPAGTPCRAGNGVCDPEERCDGSADCPADVRLPDGDSCADGDACNGAETCSGGSCASGAPPDCDDGLVCTADACDAITGCAHTPIASCCDVDAECDDGNACNGRETCAAHACTTGTPPDCDDGDACTVDACDDATGCTHEATLGCCGADIDCDDGNACTADTCDLADGTCAHVATCDAGAGTDAAVVLPDGGVASPDAGGGDASSRDGSVGNDGSMSGLDGGTGTGPAPQTGGCGCRAAGSRAPASSTALVVLVVLSWIARRRRR